DGVMVADAVELRFSGLDPLAMRGGDPAWRMGLPQTDVDLDTLRRLLPDYRSASTAALLTLCSPATTVSALHPAGDEPLWHGGLEQRVMYATVHDDHRIRAAAYAALKTRDPELWECAWLVCEARFDPDASVRSAAR